MPTNKHASFRYRVLNHCFKRPKRWNLDELVEEVSAQTSEAFGTKTAISKRTLQSDLSLMKSDPPRGFGAPIKVERGEYFYADRDFSIEKKPLNEADLSTIREALALLKQFNGLPQFQSLADMVKRIEGWVEYSERSVIGFETNELAAGTEWLPALYSRIIDRKALRVTYFPFNAEKPYEIDFHPYYLKEYRNRWFVFGLNEGEYSIHNLALDRIKGIEPSPSLYLSNEVFDPETYFRDIIGVTKPVGLTPQKITFKAEPLLSKYLQSKPLHPSQQQLGATENEVWFSIEVIPNFEMYAELARFGRALCIIEPEEVRQKWEDF